MVDDEDSPFASKEVFFFSFFYINNAYPPVRYDARKEDFRSLYMVMFGPGRWNAAGLVVRRHIGCHITTVTPLWAICDDVSRQLNDTITFM